jgi:polyisoprenoid-binding protein YceI
MTITAESIPGYKAGTWIVDPSHSEVSFSVRHLMISKVRGTFGSFSATILTGENPTDTKITASAQVASINTNDEGRDGHLRTNEFFDAENHPTIEFASTSVAAAGSDYKVMGNLSLRGVTKPVDFALEFGGFATDPYGNYKMAATVTGEINREDFGLSWNTALETGGVLVGEKVTITIELQAALQA